MIVIITGASHTGKTKAAQALLERYQFPYLSIDHLKMGLIRSGCTALTPEDDDELTAYLWPIVREIIKTAVENGQNLTVEGCYIPFDWMDSFEERYLKQIRFFCLAMTERYLRGNFAAIRQFANAVETRGDDSQCTPEALLAENRKYEEGFQAHGLPVLPIDETYEVEIRL